MLTDEEKQRVNRICKALLHERKIFTSQFQRWLNGEHRSEREFNWGLSRNDDRLRPFKRELTCIMQKAVPEFLYDHVPTMVDLYAAEHGFRWDGEPLKKGDEIWIGVGNARIERSQNRSS